MNESESYKTALEKLKKFPVESKAKFRQIMPDLANLNLSESLFSEIETMTDDEFAVFLDILQETASCGESSTYTQLRYNDYTEIPVDIRTFICDDNYLGNSTQNGGLIYPFWMDVLEKIFAPDSKIVEVILTGPIGAGKSTIAVIGMAYILYKLMCLKNPTEYYNLVEGSKIAEAIFNIDINHVTGIGFDKMQSMLKRSPWFIKNGTLRGRSAQQAKQLILNDAPVSQDLLNELTYEPSNDITLLIGSKTSHFTGFDIFCAFLDEMNFYEKGRKSDITIDSFMDMEIMKVYTAIKRRMQSRFMMQGKVPGIIFMISSKRSEDDALEKYAQRYLNDPTVLIVDQPIWVIKNLPDIYSGATFKLLVGDRFNKTRILSDSEDWSTFIEQGRRVIDVPIEHRRDFELDPDQAQTDIAGIALAAGSLFIDAPKYTATISKVRKNAFIQDEIISGMLTPDDLISRVDVARIDPIIRMRPMFIHIDTSKNKDRTGIAITAKLNEYKEVERLELGSVTNVRDLSYTTVAATGIKAAHGDMIPYRKIIDLILYLRAAGLNIAGISTDTYQSLFLQQELMQNGFNVTTLSLDRTPSGYLSYRLALYEKRIDSIDNGLLTNEMINLVFHSQANKVDHPVEGSKDIADAVVGSYYTAVITVSKGISSSELARYQEEALDSQLGLANTIQTFNDRPVRSLKDTLFAEIDDILNDDNW